MSVLGIGWRRNLSWEERLDYKNEFQNEKWERGQDPDRCLNCLMHFKKSSSYGGSQFITTSIRANGTAIGVVCVTGAANRPVVPVVSKERVPVASRYGAIFAITVSAGDGAIAVQGDGY